MINTVNLLLVAHCLSVCHALICPPPFRDILGVCLHFPGTKMSWCKAQAFCSSVDGELVRGSRFLPLDGRTFSGMPSKYWLGLTDFLHEQGKKRNGWLWTDGTLEPASSQLNWTSGEPSNPLEDCACQCEGTGHLTDHPCHWSAHPMCQIRSLPAMTSRVRYFTSVGVALGLTVKTAAQQHGCTVLLLGVASKIECAILCSVEPKSWCVSFYFSQGQGQCRLVLYTDATINLRDVPGWVKFLLRK